VILQIMENGPDKSKSFLSSWGLFPSAFWIFGELGALILIFTSVELFHWIMRFAHWLWH